MPNDGWKDGVSPEGNPTRTRPAPADQTFSPQPPDEGLQLAEKYETIRFYEAEVRHAIARLAETAGRVGFAREQRDRAERRTADFIAELKRERERSRENEAEVAALVKCVTHGYQLRDGGGTARFRVESHATGVPMYGLGRLLAEAVSDLEAKVQHWKLDNPGFSIVDEKWRRTRRSKKSRRTKKRSDAERRMVRLARNNRVVR